MKFVVVSLLFCCCFVANIAHADSCSSSSVTALERQAVAEAIKSECTAQPVDDLVISEIGKFCVVDGGAGSYFVVSSNAGNSAIVMTNEAGNSFVASVKGCTNNNP